MRAPEFETVFGVDFSGARMAGRTIWVARVEAGGAIRGPREASGSARPTIAERAPPLRLVALDRLESLCGTAERGPALAHLVRRVLQSESALWGVDAPFGLPLELFPAGAPWSEHFALLDEYDDPYECGLECIRRTKRMPKSELRTRLHCRRQTDRETRAPFDAFHYRMIYQTYYGMRDVVKPLAAAPRTAVLPFQYAKLPTARRALVESCPACVLKANALPHQNYKQPKGGPLARKCVRVRHTILEWLGARVELSEQFRRAIMRNPGGDALDAVLAAVGAWDGFRAADHAAIRRHDRYPREGRIYV